MLYRCKERQAIEQTENIWYDIAEINILEDGTIV